MAYAGPPGDRALPGTGILFHEVASETLPGCDQNDQASSCGLAHLRTEPVFAAMDFTFDPFGPSRRRPTRNTGS